jgi:hypothetical protein
MSREVEKIYCQDCESEYKILYEPEATSGLPKFCTFCSSEVFNQEDRTAEDGDDD